MSGNIRIRDTCKKKKRKKQKTRCHTNRSSYEGEAAERLLVINEM